MASYDAKPSYFLISSELGGALPLRFDEHSMLIDAFTVD
jgi:hypothetical protein